MAKMKDTETPQVTATRLATKVYGGRAPGKEDVIKSANVKGGSRHELKGQNVADESVLPKSGGKSLDKSGVDNSNYIVKKGTPFGVNAFFNTLPPGTDIEDQEIADIRKMELVDIVDHRGYPGDGWRS